MGKNGLFSAHRLILTGGIRGWARRMCRASFFEGGAWALSRVCKSGAVGGYLLLAR
jgi:hypothetical protein